MARSVCLSILLMTLSGAFLSAQSSFSRGEELFMRNEPEAALPALEAALVEDPANLKTYHYLGVVYQQLARPEDAIAVYLKALPRSGAETPRIAFNLGNAYFGMGNYAQAIRFYTESIDANPSYASAWLNRANARLQDGAQQEAIADYRYYLTLEPRSSKRPQIEQLIAFIAQEAVIAEQHRIAEEERARVEAERVRLEAERRQRLMEEVSASLQADAGETRGLSAGSEGLLDYEGEFVLE